MSVINKLTVGLDIVGCVPVVGSLVGLGETVIATILTIQECAKTRLLKRELKQELKRNLAIHVEYKQVAKEWSKQLKKAVADAREEEHVLDQRIEQLKQKLEKKTIASNGEIEKVKSEMMALGIAVVEKAKQQTYETEMSRLVWDEISTVYEREKWLLEGKLIRIEKQLHNNEMKTLEFGQHIVDGLNRVTFIGGIGVALIDLGTYLYERYKNKKVSSGRPMSMQQWQTAMHHQKTATNCNLGSHRIRAVSVNAI